MPSIATPWKEHLKSVIGFLTPKCRTKDDSKGRPNIFPWKRKQKPLSCAPQDLVAPENRYLDLKPLPSLPVERGSIIEAQFIVERPPHDINQRSWPPLNQDGDLPLTESESDLSLLSSSPAPTERPPYRLHYGPQTENIENMSYFAKIKSHRPCGRRRQEHDDVWIQDMDEEVARLTGHGRHEGFSEATRCRASRGRYLEGHKASIMASSCPTAPPASHSVASTSGLSHKLTRGFSSRVSPGIPLQKTAYLIPRNDTTASSFSSSSSLSSSSSSLIEATFRENLRAIQSLLASLEHTMPNYIGTEPRLPPSNPTETANKGKATIYQRRMLNPSKGSQPRDYREPPSLRHITAQGPSNHSRHDVRSPNMVALTPCTTSFRYWDEQLDSGGKHEGLRPGPDRALEQKLDPEKEHLKHKGGHLCQYELEKVLRETSQMVKKYEMDVMQDWQFKFKQLEANILLLQEQTRGSNL